jgi:ABC-type multidrug transport system fused ATPase/permease subunit
LTKVTSDTNDLKELFGESILNFTTHLLILIGMCVAMFALNWKLTLIVLATLPVLGYSMGHLFWKIKTAARRQRKKEGEIASRISETLASVTLVQAFGREKYEEEAFDAESTQTLEESVRTARMEAAASRMVKMISAVGTWAVVLVGSWQVLEGQMTPGDVLIFWAYVSKMFKPIHGLVKLSTKFTRALVSVERINDILEIEPDVQDDPDAITARNVKGEIVFEDVSFDYGDGKEVLKHASFTITPGQRVALVGSSGAGKSTIVCLLLRFFDPQEGTILIDGVNIKRYRRKSLRQEIGVVLQESILFGTTIRENIAYGKPDATLEEIVAAAKAANAHDFIMELENGYDTVIGERGATLSGGQRQRLAIGRALIRNAPILILDEPMTGLDVESEAKVREALACLMAGKTCLVITHDLEVAAETDLVLVLEEGRIVECGDPTDLVAANGLYRQLYERKSGRPAGDGRVVQDSPESLSLSSSGRSVR